MAIGVLPIPAPVRHPPFSKAKVFLGATFVTLLLIGTARAYLRRHPTEAEKLLAHGRLWAYEDSLYSLVTVGGRTASVDAEQLVEADDDVASHAKDKRRWRASKGMNAPPKLPTDGTDHGGMLPHISVQYLPYTIVGFMLAVPILTVSVLKGCWFLIDLFVPMQGAPQPDNYAARKHREADVEVGFSGDAANICGRTAAAT